MANFNKLPAVKNAATPLPGIIRLFARFAVMFNFKFAEDLVRSNNVFDILKCVYKSNATK